MKKPTRVTHPASVPIPDGNVPLVGPIYRTVKFSYPTIESSLTPEARREGFDYTRDSNPTTRQLELLCAELQDRDDAIAVATGMASIWLALLGNLKAGDRVVLFLETYRPTRVAVRKFLAGLGIEHSLVSIHDKKAIEEAFALEDTKLVIFESPTNPMLIVSDIAWMCEKAGEHDVTTVLDNTFAGLHAHGQYPVDYYIHSLTKFAGGHGDAMGGIVIGAADRIARIRPLAVNMGSTMDPGVAFLMLRGLRTYYLRYERHGENALAIAQFLQSRKEVRRVSYPGLQDDPGHALACEQMQGFGGVLSFELDTDEAGAWKFIDALQIFVTTASLGSTESLVAPARLYLCGDLSADELQRCGVTPSTVRLAVGTEAIDDLIGDLEQALDTAFSAA